MVHARPRPGLWPLSQPRLAFWTQPHTPAHDRRSLRPPAQRKRFRQEMLAARNTSDRKSSSLHKKTIPPQCPPEKPHFSISSIHFQVPCVWCFRRFIPQEWDETPTHLAQRRRAFFFTTYLPVSPSFIPRVHWKCGVSRFHRPVTKHGSQRPCWRIFKHGWLENPVGKNHSKGQKWKKDRSQPWSPHASLKRLCPPHQIIRFIMRQNKCCHWWKVHIALLQLSHALASSHSRQCVVHLQTMCHILPKVPRTYANVGLSQVSSLPLCALDRPFLPVPWSRLHISNMFAATLTLLRVWLQVAMKIKLMLLPHSTYCSQGVAKFGNLIPYEDIDDVITPNNILLTGGGEFWSLMKIKLMLLPQSTYCS